MQTRYVRLTVGHGTASLLIFCPQMEVRRSFMPQCLPVPHKLLTQLTLVIRIETNCLIIAACIPTLGPIIQVVKSKAGVYSRKQQQSLKKYQRFDSEDGPVRRVPAQAKGTEQWLESDNSQHQSFKLDTLDRSGVVRVSN